MNKCLKRFGTVIVTGLALILTIQPSKVLAFSEEETYRNILINNIQSCYNALTNRITATDYSNFESLMNDGYKKDDKTSHSVKIPDYDIGGLNEYDETGDDGGRVTSCYALFMGDEGYNSNLLFGNGLAGKGYGLFNLYNITVPTGSRDMNALNTFMTDVLHYKADTTSASSTQYCYNVYAKANTTAAEAVKLGEYCRNEDNFPLTYGENFAFSGGAEDSDYVVSAAVSQVSRANPRSFFQITITSKNALCYDGGRGSKKCNVTRSFDLGVPEEGRVDIENTYATTYWTTDTQFYVDIIKETSEDASSRQTIYEKQSDSWKGFLETLTGSPDRIEFSDAAKYDLYTQYLIKNYGRNGTAIASNSCQADKPSTLADTATNKFYIHISGSGWCLADLDNNKINNSQAMSVFSKTQRYTLNKVINTLPELINLMGELDYSDDSAFSNPTEPASPDSPVDPEDSSDPCYDESGALGWVMCPLIVKLDETLDSIYKKMVEPFLVVDWELASPYVPKKDANGNVIYITVPKKDANGNDLKDAGGNVITEQQIQYEQEYDEDGNPVYNDDGTPVNRKTGTYQAWEIFRNIANTLFFVLFIIVIFSQITGFGIDNYGIKRILPKLIVAAVLINLSYIICQLAVDISNALGSGFNAMLSNLAKDIGEPIGDFSSGTWFKYMLNALVGILGIGGGAAVVLTLGEDGLLGGIILPLLLGLFIAFVAVLFFFALLGIREAAIIILIAVSPIAVVCYMLPNTKRIFDRWFGILKGLLLVYPICGLLIGGGTLASRMLLNGADSFFIYMIGLLISVVPFFFVPVLVKGAFNAMGNIGAKITGFGTRMSHSATARADKGIRSSDTFRRADNALGRMSLSARRRAAAMEGTTVLARERAARARLGNRENMAVRIASTAAAEEAKAVDEATGQRLSLMMSSGEGGGIVMQDGTHAAYTLANAETRMKELEQVSRGRALSTSEKLELSALARGMSSMKGGGGKIGKVIRGAATTDANGNQTVNSNFMSAFGEIYTRDAAVQGKLNEKDAGASVFTEQFMPGGAGLPKNGQAPTFTSTFASFQGTADYSNAVSKRIKSYEAGLNQGGAAVSEYIRTLNAADAQHIMDDDSLLNSLDTDVRAEFLGHAATLGVTRKSAQEVTGAVTVQPTASQVGSQAGTSQSQPTSPQPQPQQVSPQPQSNTLQPQPQQVNPQPQSNASQSQSSVPRPQSANPRPQITVTPPHPTAPLPDGYTQTDAGLIIPRSASGEGQNRR